ncbi:MAG: hypothetical protein ACFB9N_15765 [Geitlerinemataceae cyanobacterium]
MTRRIRATRHLLAIPLALAIVACGNTPPATEDAATDAPPDALSDSNPDIEAIEPTEADSEPSAPDTDTPDGSAGEDSADSADATDDLSDAKGGDPALLIGKWEPIAYVRPDGVKTDLVEIPEPEREELSWEFGEDGSVRTGLSEGTFEVEDVTFTATNAESGEARTFRYTVTDSQLLVINPAGDVLELKRAE